MAGKSKARAGRSSTGSNGIETGGGNPAADPLRDAATAADGDPDGLATPLDAQEPAFSSFGQGPSEAEAQLLVYYSQMSAQQPRQFPPMAELSSRLSELGAKEAAVEEQPPDLSVPAPAMQPYGSERERQFAHIDAKLGKIEAKLDKLTAALPDGSAIAAVEIKLDSLYQSLEETREQGAADADRISRAAKEILAATNRMQESPERFEEAARQTVEDIGETVVATASRAAVLAAEHVATSMQTSAEFTGADRLEKELRELNRQSRENGERATAALDRMHCTLRDFLERGQMDRGGGSFPPPRKRSSLNDPISAPASPVYSRGNKGFGANPAATGGLDTLLVPRPRPSDPNLLRALEEAEERLKAKRISHLPEDGGGQLEPPPPPPPSFFGDDRTMPMAGIAAVALILLLVSGALYYLHVKTPAAPLHLSVMPRAGAAVAGQPLPPGEAAAPAKAVPDLASGPAVETSSPALFTASDQNARASAGQPAEEDMNVLESAARHGDREAQFRIGTLFLSDSGVDGGPAAAARWLTRAAEQGHTEAQFVLASLYERGAGVSKDESQAIAWYRKAAAAGHVRAMHNLGVLLSSSAPGQDYREAAFWFNHAALAGLTDSQYNLALLYERGLGLEQDLARAYFWYKVAAQAGDKEAVKQADRLKRMLPPSQTAAAGAQAGSWRPTVEDSAKRADRGSGAKG